MMVFVKFAFACAVAGFFLRIGWTLCGSVYGLFEAFVDRLVRRYTGDDLNP